MKKYENMQYTDKRQLHYAKPKGSVSPEEGKERGDSITEAFLEEFPQGKMSDSILVALCQQWSCADDIFRVVVANLLQWAEFPVACRLFSHDVTCLHINRFFWLGAYKIHLSGIQYAHLYIITKITQMLIDGILYHLLNI